jgi:transglutaminase-like putative cysteine protease
VDVHALLARPTAPVARPRHRRIGHFRVDGVAVVVESPLEAELPHLPLPPRGDASEDVQRFVDVAVSATEVVPALRELAAAVAREVRDRPLGGAGSGAEVLARGEGDCTEHTALFLEAAGSLGLDARPVAGLLYLSDGAVGSGLYPHAWAEVHVGGRWVGVDPTLGAFPADAARVPLGQRVDRAMDRLARGAEIRVESVR